MGLCCCWMTLAFGGCLLHSFSVAIDDHSQRAEHSLVLLWSSCPFIATPTSLLLTPIPDPWQPLIYSLWLTVHLPWQVDEQIHACYAQTMSEWLGCEAIVRQRERESHAAALAKCSSGASLDSHLHQMTGLLHVLLPSHWNLSSRQAGCRISGRREEAGLRADDQRPGGHPRATSPGATPGAARVH